MNSTMTIDRCNTTTEASAQPAAPKRLNPVQTSTWRTIGMAVLLTIALCLVVRVVLAVNQFDSALDSLNDGMKYLKADGRLTNF